MLEWMQATRHASKIVCVLTQSSLSSARCMKEFRTARAVGKLVAVACEPLERLCAVDVGASPHARDAIEYLAAGGEVLEWLGDGRVVAAGVRQCLARCGRCGCLRCQCSPFAQGAGAATAAALGRPAAACGRCGCLCCQCSPAMLLLRQPAFG